MRGYLNMVVELVVGDGATLEYVTTQRHHPEARQFGTHRATVGRDAELDWVVLGGSAERAQSRGWRATWPAAAPTSR